MPHHWDSGFWLTVGLFDYWNVTMGERGVAPAPLNSPGVVVVRMSTRVFASYAEMFSRERAMVPPALLDRKSVV